VAEASKCPRCLRLLRQKPDHTPGVWTHCWRWQFLHQAPWLAFSEAVYQHLGCIACGQGAWCRDVEEHPECGGCAYYCHVHEPRERCTGPY
jgi:hypothetical protein